ncbi:MAG: L,D-transpeptidase family protein [Syntrophobacteraceae bacterium]
MQRFILRGRFGGIFLCLALFAISACSMQKPDSSFDSSKSAENKQPESRTARQQPPREKEPVRIDYLTALTAIVNPEIYVYKEKRRLYVIQSNVMVRDYPVGLGSHPVGDKESEGDGRTPEGDFLICLKNPVSRFNKELVLNYPDRKHAERALFSGILSPPEFQEILLAAEHKAAPPFYSKLGGQLYIHAGGAHKDWTQGSIALYNSDMEELFKIAFAGTPVHIRP